MLQRLRVTFTAYLENALRTAKDGRYICLCQCRGMAVGLLTLLLQWAVTVPFNIFFVTNINLSA